MSNVRKFVLFQNSGTQRVTVQIQEDNSVLVSKEWKKQVEDVWIVGKGIVFPQNELVSLGEILSCENSLELDDLLAKYKEVKDE